ncbi:hypothetical protein [Bacillus sp. JJ722]|uniref:hypothetical protein n=1 Tax=Bacillus sp. JJ722 TaxID=3122973 RepID=UPI00300029C7
MEIKEWLESTGYKVKEVRFLTPPPYPYIIFFDNTETRGADEVNLVIDHEIFIELYSESIDKVAESKIEALLEKKAYEYTKSRDWIGSESHFQTIYEFEFIEKRRNN